MADEMQPIYTSKPAPVSYVGDTGEFQTFKKPSVYVPYVQYDSIKSLSVYGSMEGVSSIYVNSHQYVLPIPRPLMTGDVWHSKVKSECDKKIVFDGSADEDWSKIVVSGIGTIWRIDQSDAFYRQTPLSNIYPSVEYVTFRREGVIYIQSVKGVIVIDILDSSINTIENWRAKLSSTPLTVYYKSTDYDGTNGLTVSIADYRDEIYANNFVDVFTDDGELWVDGGDFVEVAVNNIVLNGKTNDERAGEYGTPQVHTFP